MLIEIDNNIYINPDNIISIDKFNFKTRFNLITGNQIITPKGIKVIADKFKLVQINDTHFINPKNIVSIDKLDKYTRLTDVLGNSITTDKPIRLTVNKLNGIKPVAIKRK